MKAQLKIQEMAFMLVAVLLFFILVGLFAMSIFYSKFVEEVNEVALSKTASSIQYIADSPEFACPGTNPNCVDADKIIALSTKKDYEKFWEFSSLEVIRMSAFNKSEYQMTDCNLENYPNCDRFVIYDKKLSNQRKISSFVALCRLESENKYAYKKCEVAKLLAGTGLKTEGE
jgi:hypothetical protein